ncbi:MAG: TRAM domain-containing protein [Lentisphaeria bacterium]|nr:TRAM domain-containing protein [Lentisphaeria bacterium]
MDSKINKGDVFEVQVRDVSFGGDGVASLPDGRTVFIPYTISGELVEIELTSLHKRFARAKVLAVKEASTSREVPPCQYFGTCPGCQYQHISASKELNIKQLQLATLLQKIGGLEVLPQDFTAIDSIDHLGYRNKMVVHKKLGQWGYVGKDNKSIVPIKQCLLAHEKINEAYSNLQSKKVQAQFRYSRVSGIHFHEKGDSFNEVQDEVNSMRYHCMFPGFFQVNIPVFEKILDWISNRITGDLDHLLDLYCGVGIIGLNFADKTNHLIGIEASKSSIKLAKKNAVNFNLSCDFYDGDMKTTLPKVLNKLNLQSQKFSIILDPPRDGCDQEVIEQIAKLQPKQIFYVSCDPATFARDMKRLQEINHYKLKSAVVCNMFPQTSHFETVGLFEV